mgnify:CR=1 FL=1
MKLKEQKKLGMLYFVLGAVLAIAGYFIKSSWLASVGGGVCVLGLVRLLRAARLSRVPNRQLIMMLRFRTSEQHMLQIRRAV